VGLRQAEVFQTSNAGHEADELASRLLKSIGRDLAHLLVKGPWDQIGAALRAKLHAGAAPSSDQCRIVLNAASTPTHVDLERDPHDANLYRPKTSESDYGGIPPCLDRKLWRPAHARTPLAHAE
jgi:hypothetical protein